MTLEPGSPELVERATSYIRGRATAPASPGLGVVLGSGLGGFVEKLKVTDCFPYAVIPGMQASSVRGHESQLVLGELGPTRVACLQGRTHLYEGHPVASVVFGSRVLAALGCGVVLLTNAAGGIAPEFSPGDLMVIEDHLNLTGQNPLLGSGGRFGPSFVDLSQAYDPSLRRAALAAAARVTSELGQPFELRQGIYAGLLGPSYETPAEIRMLRVLGADAVGMSTVNEVIALRQARVRVGAVSCITNMAAGLSEGALSHAEVQATAERARAHFECFLEHWIRESTSLIH